MANNLLDKVRDSAKFVAENNTFVMINENAIELFLDSLQEPEFREKSDLVVFPLKFDSPEHEANFIGIIDLINFGSGFRHELHHASERGAYETICFGAIAMYLSNSGKLDATFLKQARLVDIGAYFNLPLSKEVALQPGLYTYQPSPLKPLAEKITSVFNETGTILLSKGFSSLGAFIMDATAPKPDTPTTAAHFVETLVNTFPAFSDKTEFQGKDIFVLKKVQLLAADLHRRFKDSLPQFNFSDVDSLTVFSDNVLPAVLRQYGILELSAPLKEHVDSKTELTNKEWEVALRVTAIHACELIVQTSTRKAGKLLFSAMQLDFFLWTKGKDPDFRKVERHYTKNTIYY